MSMIAASYATLLDMCCELEATLSNNLDLHSLTPVVLTQHMLKFMREDSIICKANKHEQKLGLGTRFEATDS